MEKTKIIMGATLNFLCKIAPRIGGKLAFYLFCIPFKIKLKPHQQKFLQPAKLEPLELYGKNVQVYKWGSGEQKVLFVHGWQSHAYIWKTYIETFDLKQYSLYAFDAPGHGNSEGIICNVPLFEATIDLINRTHGTMDAIIAHSIGSFASSYYQFVHHTNLKKFVSLASPFCAEELTAFYKNEIRLNHNSVKQLKKAFHRLTGHTVEYYSLENFASGIHADCLIVHDEGDQETQASGSEQFSNQVEKSQFVLTKGLGHRLKSENVIKLVLNFIQSDNGATYKVNNKAESKLISAENDLQKLESTSMNS